MKAYITCPCSHSDKKLYLLPTVRDVVENNGIKTFVFKIGGKAKDIFRRDYKKLKECDLLIAEVSERSHGVGIEIGISYCLGLKRILIFEKGKSITKMAIGMPNTSIIEYKNEEDLKRKLNLALRKLEK